MQAPSSNPSGPVPILPVAPHARTQRPGRTIGVCVPDPEAIETLCEALAHVEGGEVMDYAGVPQDAILAAVASASPATHGDLQ